MLVGFIILAVLIVGCALIKNAFDYGYQKGRELNKAHARAEVEAFVASEIWEYDNVESPMVRRNRLTGQVQQRYQIGDILHPRFTNWRNVFNYEGEENVTSTVQNQKGKRKTALPAHG